MLLLAAFPARLFWRPSFSNDKRGKPHQFRLRGNAIVVSISSKHQRQRKQRRRFTPQKEKDDEEEEIIGGVGQAVFTALQSGSPNTTNTSEYSSSSGVQQLANKGTTSLSGSDVLLALQRASVRKDKKRSKGSQPLIRGAQPQTDDEDDAIDYNSNVRPININNDWGARLDEMERRLQQIQKNL